MTLNDKATESPADVEMTDGSPQGGSTEEVTPPVVKKSITSDDLYRRSSQYQIWSFTNPSLENTRRQTYNKGIKLAKQKLKTARETLVNDLKSPKPDANADVVASELKIVSGPEFEIDNLFDPPTMEEELGFLNYYCQIVLNTGDFFRMPTQVKATATSFFKKFYLVNSIFEFHPKLILFTCLFLAAKLENYFMSIESFTSKLPKTEPKDVLDFEFIILLSLKFTLYVHHPFRPLYGLFLDTQAILLHLSPLMYDVNVDTLGALYDKAKKWLVDYAIISDVSFLFTPPQIALAAMYDIDKRITDRYLKRKFRNTKHIDDAAIPVDGEEIVSHEYEEIVRTIRKCIRKAKEVETPSKDKSTEIDRKHFFMQRPEKLLKRKIKQFTSANVATPVPVAEPSTTVST